MDELMAKAERVEHRPDGDYFIFSASALTGEEFADLIMEDVRRLQSDAHSNNERR